MSNLFDPNTIAIILKEYRMANESELNILHNHTAQEDNKIHSWRLCGEGRHWVKTHEMSVPSSKSHPYGNTVARQGHCANNPGHVKDMLSTDEMHAIADNRFANLPGLPVAGILTKRVGKTLTEDAFPKADNYDNLIRGWVRYWNDIFQPTDLLDPNLVKALMASESSFNEKAQNFFMHGGKKIYAFGLLQITEETWHVLNDYTHSELNNHFIQPTELALIKDNLWDPCINICSAIRWLFQKHNLLSNLHLRQAKKDPTKPYHEPSWVEVVKYYKGYTSDKANGYIKFLAFYDRLQRG